MFSKYLQILERNFHCFALIVIKFQFLFIFLFVGIFIPFFACLNNLQWILFRFGGAQINRRKNRPDNMLIDSAAAKWGLDENCHNTVDVSEFN